MIRLAATFLPTTLPAENCKLPPGPPPLLPAAGFLGLIESASNGKGFSAAASAWMYIAKKINIAAVSMEVRKLRVHLEKRSKKERKGYPWAKGEKGTTTF